MPGFVVYHEFLGTFLLLLLGRIEEGKEERKRSEEELKKEREEKIKLGTRNGKDIEEKLKKIESMEKENDKCSRLKAALEQDKLKLVEELKKENEEKRDLIINLEKGKTCC